MSKIRLASVNSLWRIFIILVFLQLFHLNSTGASMPWRNRASSSSDQPTGRPSKRPRTLDITSSNSSRSSIRSSNSPPNNKIIDFRSSNTNLLDECKKSEKVRDCCSTLLNNYNRDDIKDHVPSRCVNSLCNAMVDKRLEFYRMGELMNTCRKAIGNVYNGADIVYLYEFVQFTRPTDGMISTLLRGLTVPSNIRVKRTLERLITSHGNDYSLFNEVLRVPIFSLSINDIFDCLTCPQIYTAYEYITSNGTSIKIHFLKVKWIVMPYCRFNIQCPIGNENPGLKKLIYTVEQMTTDTQYGAAISEAIALFLRHHLTETDMFTIMDLIQIPSVIGALTPPPSGSWNGFSWSFANVINFAVKDCSRDLNYHTCIQKWIYIVYNLNSLTVDVKYVIRHSGCSFATKYVSCLYSVTAYLAYNVTYEAKCKIPKELLREMFLIYYLGGWSFLESPEALLDKFQVKIYNQVMYDKYYCLNFIYKISNLTGTHKEKWNQL